jgi:hypothetical protein
MPGAAHPKKRKRPLASSNDVFSLSFARLIIAIDFEKETAKGETGGDGDGDP